MAVVEFSKVYNLGDYLAAKTVNIYETTYSFQIPTSPTIILYSDQKFASVGASGKWFDVSFQNGIRNPYFWIFPLSQEVLDDEDKPRNVIDITDFKPETLVTFSTSFSMRLKFAYNQYGFGDTILPVVGYYNIFCYDKDGKFISRTSTGHFNADLTLPDASSDTNIGSSEGIYPFSALQSVTIPNNCAYIVPTIYLSFPNYSNDPAQVTSCQPVYNSMTIRVKESSILVQSELMKDISSQLEDTNDQLGDLNDKTDTIINGTDDQQQDADRLQGIVQDEDETLSDAIDELQEFQKFDTQSIFGAINDFLEADGWDDIRYLLEPLLQWQYTSTMMLFILAFSTLRILLLGR